VCVLLIHHRTRPDWPLVLLANRDEFFNRPFDPPALVDEARGIVAPRDRRARGTWIGRNGRGLVVAITNRRGEDVRPAARSRGLLVGDLLRLPDARAARDAALAEVRGVPYAGFHLLVADGRDAFVVRHRLDGRGDDVVALPPGAHILTNLHELDELTIPPGGGPEPSERIERTLERLERLAGDATPSLPGGHRILKREARRGTVCSATLALPPDGGPGIFRFADGPPDVTPFRPVG
jgi:hypothetical protein